MVSFSAIFQKSAGCSASRSGALAKALVGALPFFLLIAAGVSALPAVAAEPGERPKANFVKVALSSPTNSAIADITRDRDRPISLVAIAATGSMLPTFDENYIVVLEECAIEDIRLGDVIVTRNRTPQPVLHRVVRVNADGTLVTQGDACAAVDALPTDRELFQGRRAIAAVHRRNGRIVWLSDRRANVALAEIGSGETRAATARERESARRQAGRNGNGRQTVLDTVGANKSG